jgi:decaprenylphospho-beta-D-ribofuranose 2-oxidase
MKQISGCVKNIVSFMLDHQEFAVSADQARGSIPSGLRRSYGDASVNSGGLDRSSSSLKSLKIDAESGIAKCESGVTLGELSRQALKLGWFPRVLPGTEFVTVGGAIASDIHGKSHHLDGSFSKSLLEITLITGAEEKITLNKFPETSKFFWATVGGMGLTGFIQEAKIQLQKVENKYIFQEEYRAQNLDLLLRKLEEQDKFFPYTVAWIDLSGDFAGRGIVSSGKHAETSALPRILKKNSNLLTEPRVVSVPNIFPSKSINAGAVRIFNEFWYRKPLTNGIVNVQKFMHPLDKFRNWNNLYGKNGFVQYQFVIPFNEVDFLHSVMKTLKSMRFGSSLGVLKSFGDSSEGYLSFPKPGWTLAVDIPRWVPNLQRVLNGFDEELVNRNGRIYLTKDSRMSSEYIAAMYPRIFEWQQIRNQMDPFHAWKSDLSRRLKLC